MSGVIAAAIGGAGLLTTLYGANKQSKDDAATRQLNYQAQQEAERQNWARWLATRGIAPGANTQTGVIPGVAPGGIVNTKLPYWLNVSRPQVNPYAARAAALPFIVRKGAAPAAAPPPPLSP